MRHKYRSEFIFVSHLLYMYKSDINVSEQTFVFYSLFVKISINNFIFTEINI